MKELCKAVAATIVVFLIFSILLVFILPIKQPKETKTTATTTDTTEIATVTDIVGTMIEKETTTEAVATDTDATTEEKCVEIPTKKEIFTIRENGQVDIKNKTSLSKLTGYIITKEEKSYHIETLGKTISWDATILDEDRYAVSRIAIRKTPNIEAEDFWYLEPATLVRVVAISENGWDIIEYKDSYYFIWYEDVSTLPPTTEEPIIVAEEPVTEATTQAPEVTEAPAPAPAESTTAYYTPADFRVMGVIYFEGYAWTYYSERILPGEGLAIPRRYTDGDGFVCDGEGYVVLASCDLAKGTVIMTPVGRVGKVYDYCPTSGVIDVYTNW